MRSETPLLSIVRRVFLIEYIIGALVILLSPLILRLYLKFFIFLCFCIIRCPFRLEFLGGNLVSVAGKIQPAEKTNTYFY